MIPACYDFPTQYSGDTFNAVQITATRTDINDVTTAIDLTNVDIRAHFKKKVSGTPDKEISVGSGITKTDAENGVFEIDTFINLAGGVYLYDLEFTYASGVIQTYLKGTYTVTEDITE